MPTIPALRLCAAVLLLPLLGAPRTSANIGRRASGELPEASLLANTIQAFGAHPMHSFDSATAVIPEPTTYAAALGAATLATVLWRRRRAARRERFLHLP